MTGESRVALVTGAARGIGLAAAQDAEIDPAVPIVTLATAHPAKFREVVEPIVGTPVPMPDALAATLARKRVVQHISPSLRELSALL